MEQVTHLAQMIDLDLSHLVGLFIIGVIGYFLKSIMDNLKEMNRKLQRHDIMLAKIQTRLKIEDEEETR